VFQLVQAEMFARTRQAERLGTGGMQARRVLGADGTELYELTGKGGLDGEGRHEPIMAGTSTG
jgi:hypothetical protein